MHGSRSKKKKFTCLAIETLHIGFYLKLLHVLAVQFNHFQVGSQIMLAETNIHDLYSSVYWTVKIQ
jgi:hypothetical protein